MTIYHNAAIQDSHTLGYKKFQQNYCQSETILRWVTVCR